MTKEEILKEFAEKITDYGYYNNECGYYVDWKDGVMPIVEKYANIIIAQTREETIKEEIDYWKDVFDNRPKDRDLESDNIAQNFARIEIERLENKLKKYETIRTI